LQKWQGKRIGAMTKAKSADYISRGIVLHKDVWAELERLRKVDGSYNKVLRRVLKIKPARSQ